MPSSGLIKTACVIILGLSISGEIATSYRRFVATKLKNIGLLWTHKHTDM